MRRLFALALISTTTAHAAPPQLSAKVEVTGRYTATIRVNTSLPTGVTLGVTLRFADAKVTDPPLNTRLYKAVVKGGTAVVNVNEAGSISSLPNGRYNVKVFYSPLFFENIDYLEKGYRESAVTTLAINLIADNLKYRDIINARARFDKASDEYSKSKRFNRDDALRLFSRYGGYTSATYKNEDSSGIAYYYPNIDGTLVIYDDGDIYLSRGRLFRNF